MQYETLIKLGSASKCLTYIPDCVITLNLYSGTDNRVQGAI